MFNPEDLVLAIRYADKEVPGGQEIRISKTAIKTGNDIELYSKSLLKKIYIPFRFTREQINTSAKPDGSGLQPAIKSMPQFDPDSEVTGLALTIPSWANSIERTRNNTDLSIVSSEAKNNLEKALSDLLEVISEIMLAIKE